MCVNGEGGSRKPFYCIGTRDSRNAVPYAGARHICTVNERQEFGNPVLLHGVSNMMPKGVRLCDRGVRCYPTLSRMQDRIFAAIVLCRNVLMEIDDGFIVHL